jgi:catechol 2,3-dioxygenase-like lactoylglutathione lyase family enzyme
MMFSSKAGFSSFSVDNLEKAKEFYTGVLGLAIDEESMGIRLHLQNNGDVFVYPKDDHQPASFTVLNFMVENIDEAVDELTSAGVQFERYEGQLKTDEKGIARSSFSGMGPDIAWFKDPAGNVLSVLEDT